MTEGHVAIEELFAIETGEHENRVIAVKTRRHDAPSRR